MKARFNTAEWLASSSGAGANFNPRTGSSATTASEQRVIDDFAASNLVFITSVNFLFVSNECTELSTRWFPVL